MAFSASSFITQKKQGGNGHGTVSVRNKSENVLSTTGTDLVLFSKKCTRAVLSSFPEGLSHVSFLRGSCHSWSLLLQHSLESRDARQRVRSVTVRVTRESGTRATCDFEDRCHHDFTGADGQVMCSTKHYAKQLALR